MKCTVPICNLDDLAIDDAHRRALDILQAGLDAAHPAAALSRRTRDGAILVRGEWVDLTPYDVNVVAFGKAAGVMADTVCHKIDVSDGMVVVPSGAPAGPDTLRTLYASHPLPDQSSVDAANAVIEFLGGMNESNYVIFLVSGGASSLLCKPAGISLEQKQDTYKMLLDADISIESINAVRKHLSGIKGGQLVSGLRCKAASLIMSDVPRNDPSTIASGITYCDVTTFSDALAVLNMNEFAGRVLPDVYQQIQRGVAGDLDETPKEPMIPNEVIATNEDCLAAMSNKASLMGYTPTIYRTNRDVRDVAGMLANEAKNMGRCIIFGGEPTVRVQGSGLGGRSQELVLRTLAASVDAGNAAVVASMGTDGIDGNTQYAGAIMRGPCIDVKFADAALKSSDSNSYFVRYGGLIYTGHTGTNLMDIGILLT